MYWSTSASAFVGQRAKETPVPGSMKAQFRNQTACILRQNMMAPYLQFQKHPWIEIAPTSHVVGTSRGEVTDRPTNGEVSV